MKVGLKGQPPLVEVRPVCARGVEISQGELFQKVKVDDCLWTLGEGRGAFRNRSDGLDGNKLVMITLSKVNDVRRGGGFV